MPLGDAGGAGTGGGRGDSSGSDGTKRGGGGGRGGAGGGGVDSGAPDCQPWETAYNSPVRGWVCVGNNPADAHGGGGGAETGGAWDYQTPEYTGPARPQYNIGPAPEFIGPGFEAPTADSIYADPSYQFRLDQGQKALEASAAARGVTRSGGTLTGVLEYGQNFASQEYGNIFNRALQDYDRKYRAAYDRFAPKFSEWETRTGAEVGAGNLAFQAALDRYFFGINDDFRRQEMIFGARNG